MIVKFWCEQHNIDLSGQPTLVSQEDILQPGVLTWVLDTSEMWCPDGNNTQADMENDCYQSWTITS
jgi:hypothetical protein